MQENSVFMDWLHRAHITPSVISDFGVHTGLHPIIGECIVIPVCDSNGVHLYNKYRRNPMHDAKPKYLYDKGGKVELYGLYKAKNHNTILITEGEKDCLVAWSKNIPAVTSTGGAHSFQKEWSEDLVGKEVMICLDNDQAGGEGMAKILDILPDASIVFLPDRSGIKDIADYVSSGGDLNELLRTAKKFNTLQEVQDHRAERLSLWQSTWFHDAYIEQHTKPAYVPRTSKDTDDDVTRAKGYPIPNLIEFKQKKAKCIWHNEATPSLTYYTSSNTVYCFGCGKHGDAIAVYRTINNCSFKEAIEALK